MIYQSNPKTDFISQWLVAAAVAAVVCSLADPSAVIGAQKVPVPTPAVMPSDALAGYTISKIEIVGASPANEKLIRNQIRVMPGETYDRAEVAVDVRSIASLGLFYSVEAQIVPQRHRRVVVRYVVKERRVLKRVEFQGNRHVRTHTLKDLVLAQPGKPIDPFFFQTDINAIRHLYRSKGFLYCEVKLNRADLARGIADYQITEGPRVFIRAVHFIGNNLYPSWFLHFKAATSSRWKLFWLITVHKGELSKHELQSDLSMLRHLWHKKGYLDCRTAYRLVFSPDYHRVVVDFIIHPGVRYRIGKIFFKGDTVFPRAELLKLVRFKPGMYYDRDLIKAGQRRVADLFGKAGYIYSQVLPTFAYTQRAGIVNLDYHIKEGKTYRVGRVIIRGNTQVQDHVARRQIRLFPNHLYDTTAVRRSNQHLDALGLFSHAHTTPIGSKPGVRNALVSLTPSQTGRFAIGVGVSSDAGLLGQISVTQQNFDITDFPHSIGELLRGQAFKGNGQYFSISAEPGTVYQLYKATFAEPYLWDSPYSLRNTGYFFTEIYNTYNLNRLGDRITLGRRITRHLTLTLAFRWENVNPNNIQSDSAPEIQAQAGNHYLSSITPGIEYNRTVGGILPYRGYELGATWEQYGAMGGNYTFSKIDLFGTYYHTLYRDLFGRRTILMLRGDVGFIPIGNSVFFERFYAGGIGSLRGFTYQGVTPRAGPQLDGIGGNFMYVTTAEVNYPLYQKILRGVAFVDVGDVESNVHFGQLRADFGVGVRIILPFFGRLPLGIDFAYPIIHGPQDHISYVSFALGIPM